MRQRPQVVQETGRTQDKDRSPGYKEYAVRARVWLKRRAKPREPTTELPSVIAHDDQHPSISVSHGQLRRPRARLDDRRDGLRRRPGSGTHARCFGGAGLEPNRHLDHASSRRSHSGRAGREGKIPKREGVGPGQGRVANSFPRSSGEGRGHGPASDRSRAKVIETPGHTLGHIAYHFEKDDVAFCGDTLFSLGCGRVFEAPLAVMWSSLAKLAALPGETQIYCGHEYTQANGRFALTIEPGNPVLKARIEEIARLRAARSADRAHDDCSRACRQSVSARGGAGDSDRGRHGRRGACGGVWGTPDAQGPILGRLGLLGQGFEPLLHVG